MTVSARALSGPANPWIGPAERRHGSVSTWPDNGVAIMAASCRRKEARPKRSCEGHLPPRANGMARKGLKTIERRCVALFPCCWRKAMNARREPADSGSVRPFLPLPHHIRPVQSQKRSCTRREPLPQRSTESRRAARQAGSTLWALVSPSFAGESGPASDEESFLSSFFASFSSFFFFFSISRLRFSKLYWFFAK